MQKDEFMDHPATKRLKSLAGPVITSRAVQQSKSVHSAAEAKALLIAAAKHGMGTIRKGNTMRSMELVKN